MLSRRMVMVVGLIILLTSLVLILSLSSRQPTPAYGPGRFALTLVSPFQKVIMGTTRFVRGIWEHYFFLVSVAEENQRLNRELRRSMARNHEFNETVLMNERLRQLLGLTRKMQLMAVAAQVVGKDPSPWFQTVIVDKGSEDGVEKGQPVVNAQGIVGIVTTASGHYSKVMLLTDPNSAVDAVVQHNRARGIVKGGATGSCVFNFVLRKHNVNVGDTVVSSGMDRVFPKGLPVGEVASIIKHEAGIFQDVTITPYVDFERLEEVLIVPLTEPVDAP